MNTMQSIAQIPDHLKTRAKGKSTSPFVLDSRDRIVKGFFSVQNLDSSGDYVKPEAFKFDGYKQNPQVLFEHKYFIDEAGNKSSIGKCLDVFPATIKDEGDPVYLSVYNDTGEKVDMFPRSKAFRLEDGTRGVWCALEITNNVIWPKIQNGEYNALSWQGFCQIQKHGDFKYIQSVDLIEITITAIPDNRSSKFYIPNTFNVLKSLILDAGKFNQDQVIDFVDKYNLSDYGIFQVDNKWIISKSSIIDEPITEEIADLGLVLDQEENMDNTEKDKTTDTTVSPPNVEDTKVETSTTDTSNTENSTTENSTTVAEEVKVDEQAVTVEKSDVKITTVSIEMFEQFKSEITKNFSGLETSVTELDNKVKSLVTDEKKSTDIKEEQFTKGLEEIKKSLKDIIEFKETLKKSFIEPDRQENVDLDTRSEESKKNDVFNPFFGL